MSIISEFNCAAIILKLKKIKIKNNLTFPSNTNYTTIVPLL
jgi:hypothetical protein